MAPITSVAAALQKHVAPRTVARRAVLRMLDRQASLSRASSAVRAAASTLTLSTEADSEINRPIEDVVVVGAGIAGLATAACLGRLGVQVTVATGRPKKEARVPAEGSVGPGPGPGPGGAGDKKKHAGGPAHEAEGDGTPLPGGGVGGAVFDPGVGIWTHGLACLDELGILRRLEEEGRYMGVAGYRDAAGHWLATPSQPLQAYDAPHETSNPPDGRRGGRVAGSGASVLFVRESKLIEALRSAVPENATFISADVEDISWGSGGCDNGTGGTTAHRGKTEESGGGSGRGTASGRLCGGSNTGDSPAAASRWAAEFDLIVGADGPNSFVREEAMLASLGAAATAAVVAAAPQRRGYVVYRGVCRGDKRSAAAVEVPGGGEGGGQEGWGLDSFQTWGPGLRFASVPLAGDERMWFATVADGVGDCSAGKGGGEGRSRRLELAASPSPGETKAFLLKHFGGWHAPISSLIRATEEMGVAREDARAMSRLGLRAAAGAGAGAGAGAALRRAGRGFVLVGDAAHTLDPVLAQGAGVALEDAFFLARHVKDLNAAATSAADGRTAGTAREGLEQTLARYDAERLERALLLSYLSDVSQTLGQLRRPGWLVRARDSFLARLVPSKLRSRGFDALMSASLSGRLAGALSAAGRSATGVGGRGGGGGRERFGGYGVPRL